ncbi:MAG: tRNA preQ1(34) S-adenosylmethionine ribosyltransferase-isomerase QueA [Fibrobacteres bacterium]|nr:tRNA preQ1(34) S-adenosylmethionine ribosyltransferase-isomerase QueA [Fibrobacterota bacterium]
MDIADYDYDLPSDLIAQHPAEPREASRLCVWNHGKIEHKSEFRNIVDYFREGDCLVVNNTKVIPARLIGKRESGGKVEIFLIDQGADREWVIIGKPGRALRKGEVVSLEGGVTAEIVAAPYDDARRIVRFSVGAEELYKIGRIPLPPYIKREASEQDNKRYQTVFAKENGAVAAPTASLHFTDRLIAVLKQKGVMVAEITLHVGLGTFKPVTVMDASEHVVEKERFSVSKEACSIINKTRENGGKIFASGTTVAKALETAAISGVPLMERSGRSDLYIYPPFKFRVVDALVTNFHVPRSTLLLLVSAFIGKDNVIKMYREAVQQKYRFLSYGDATLLMP